MRALAGWTTQRRSTSNDQQSSGIDAVDSVTVSRTGIWSSRGLLCVSVRVSICVYVLCVGELVGEGEGEREAPRADGLVLGEGELDDISRANE